MIYVCVYIYIHMRISTDLAHLEMIFFSLKGDFLMTSICNIRDIKILPYFLKLLDFWSQIFRTS